MKRLALIPLACAILAGCAVEEKQPGAETVSVSEAKKHWEEAKKKYQEQQSNRVETEAPSPVAVAGVLEYVPYDEVPAAADNLNPDIALFGCDSARRAIQSRTDSALEHGYDAAERDDLAGWQLSYKIKCHDNPNWGLGEGWRN